MNTEQRYQLRITCPGSTGLVPAIAGFLADQHCFITELSQFDDIQTGRSFCGAEFFKSESGLTPVDLSDLFFIIGSWFEMDCRFIDRAAPPLSLILVSKFEHNLDDLSYRKQTGELNIDVTTVTSNYPDLGPSARFCRALYVVLLIGKSKLATKGAQEDRIRELIDEQCADPVILACAMQVLSAELCQDLAGHCINVHHSFLASFRGARPYQQAFERGVKAIGATVHYVTADLDEGPIIDQEVARVDHTFGPEQQLTTGRNMENYALSRAVKVHSEPRVFLNGH